jgi:hypothetical protein
LFIRRRRIYPPVADLSKNIKDRSLIKTETLFKHFPKIPNSQNQITIHLDWPAPRPLKSAPNEQ